MSFDCDTEGLSNTIPAGYMAVQVSTPLNTHALPLAVLVRHDPHGSNHFLLPLRNIHGAKTFLGCICDHAGRVLQWIELWIQDNSCFSASSSCLRGILSNTVMDTRWQQTVDAFTILEPGEMIQTGFETCHPLPTFLDMSEQTTVHLMDSRSGTPWQLCTDDHLLLENGLPSYSTTLYRYLYVPALGKDSTFAAITQEAPRTDSTVLLSDLQGGKWIGLNPDGGYILVRKYHPLSVDAFVEALNTGRWDAGPWEERSTHPAQAIAIHNRTNPFPDNGFLFCDSSGNEGRLLEVLHLKLRFLADLIHSVQTMLQCTQRPFLNIDDITWRVRLGRSGRGLPFLWTAAPILSIPPESFPVEIEGSTFQYYLPSPFLSPSVYRPRINLNPVVGRATIRIRKVLHHDKALTIEGTFTTQQRMDIGPKDLVRFELLLPSGRIQLHAWLESVTAMAAGEWRFHSSPCHLAENHFADLQKMEGIPQPEISFEVLPLFSSPFDLYSLAVLAVRIVLVDRSTTLPLALDALMSLAHEIRGFNQQDRSLEECIGGVFASNHRWLESLGPHRLICGELRAEQAVQIVPPLLWWRTLAIILKMLPGAGSNSVCSNLGDAPQGGLHRICEPVIRELNDLIRLTRCMIVPEWNQNQIVRNVLNRYFESEH